MPGCVSDNETPFRCREIPVGDIDGDALFPFRFEPVGEEREIDLNFPVCGRKVPYRLELVFKNRFRIMEEAADEGGFPVIHASGWRKPEQGVLLVSLQKCFERGQKYPSRFFCSIELS